MITIGYWQFSPVFNQKKENLSKIKNKLDSISDEIDILVLPELATSGYFFENKEQVYSMAEEAKGETFSLLSQVASDKNMYIYCGFIEKDAENLYNSAMFIAPDKTVSIYRKSHLFYEENLYFKPGNQPFKAHSICIRGEEIKLGFLICFDWIFPESFRSLALDGAQIILHAANLVLPYCPAATITRAIENRVFVVLADRVGSEFKEGDELRFIGSSRIVSPKGELLIGSDEENEELKWVQIDPGEALDKDLNSFNHIFKDRRVNLYNL